MELLQEVRFGSSRSETHALIRALADSDGETYSHSLQVAAMAAAMARRLGVHGEELIDIEFGALLHDIGKLREFELGAEIALSEAGTLVGHVALGQQMIVERASALDGFPEEKLHSVLHCVLAHHGTDALPGRRFRTPEAVALHRLNALDASVKGALEHGLD